jgi:hypothetical protein
LYFRLTFLFRVTAYYNNHTPNENNVSCSGSHVDSTEETRIAKRAGLFSYYLPTYDYIYQATVSMRVFQLKCCMNVVCLSRNFILLDWLATTSGDKAPHYIGLICSTTLFLLPMFLPQDNANMYLLASAIQSSPCIT